MDESESDDLEQQLKQSEASAGNVADDNDKVDNVESKTDRSVALSVAVTPKVYKRISNKCVNNR